MTEDNKLHALTGLRQSFTIVQPPDWASDNHAFYRDEIPCCPVCQSALLLERTAVGGITSRRHIFKETFRCEECHTYRVIMSKIKSERLYFDDNQVVWVDPHSGEEQ